MYLYVYLHVYMCVYIYVYIYYFQTVTHALDLRDSDRDVIIFALLYGSDSAKIKEEGQRV